LTAMGCMTISNPVIRFGFLNKVFRDEVNSSARVASNDRFC
jgi:hypothetical protein